MSRPNPVEYWFSLLDERTNVDDLDDRLLLLRRLDIGTVERIISDLRILGDPRGSIWTPRWQHRDPKELQQLESMLEGVTRSADERSKLIVLSRDLREFSKGWEYEACPEGQNWFDWLGL